MSANFQNEKFDSYFSQVYGARWSSLKEKLYQQETQILRRNYFSNWSPALLNEYKLVEAPIESTFQIRSQQEALHLLKDDQDIKYFYKMDPASVIVAQALPVLPEDRVLDMCAAPGGKTLILAEKLSSDGELICNEISASRRDRLTRVLKEYIPFERRQNIFVKGKDGNAFGRFEPESYDKILLDAPCSGERHLIENSEEFAQWTLRRSENLAVRQYSLLSSAYHALKVGGYLVYSTCSISPLENDGVLKKLNKKREVEFIDLENLSHLECIEKTEYGYQILPDGPGAGYGPMYFSLFRKV